VFTFLVVGCAVLGLAVGSFLNVVIYRVPRQLSIVSPRSACPACHTPIRDRDNIPLLSWVLLKGRCRACQSPISPRYPLVEATCSGLFAGVAARVGLHWYVPAFLIMMASLLALAVIDLEHMVLPKKIIYPTLAGMVVVLVAVAGIDHEWHRLLVAAICALSWFLLFFLLNLISPRILGFGDVRLAPILGLGLGWFGIRYVILGFFAANLVGAVIGVTLIAMKKMKRDQPVPYGVFLAVGTMVAIFAGQLLLAPFQHVSINWGGL
jgi:leader peptidase (prepilin peptidase)/N-methyltransferase